MTIRLTHEERAKWWRDNRGHMAMSEEDLAAGDILHGYTQPENSESDLAGLTYTAKDENDLCIDEGCPHHGTPHTCNIRVETDEEHALRILGESPTGRYRPNLWPLMSQQPPLGPDYIIHDVKDLDYADLEKRVLGWDVGSYDMTILTRRFNSKGLTYPRKPNSMPGLGKDRSKTKAARKQRNRNRN